MELSHFVLPSAASAWGAQAASHKNRWWPRGQRHVITTATKLTWHHTWKRKESRILRTPSLLGKSEKFQRAFHHTCSCHQIGSSMRSTWRNSTNFWREQRNYPPLWLIVLRRSEKGATSRYLSEYLCEILWAALWRSIQRYMEDSTRMSECTAVRSWQPSYMTLNQESNRSNRFRESGIQQLADFLFL